MIKIASWNVNSLRVRWSHLSIWLQQQQPDIVALQETKVQNIDFPRQDIEASGYQVAFHGQKTFNGVAILSKQTIQEVQTHIPNFEDPQCRLIASTIGDIRVINLYVPNGQSVDSDKYQYKIKWLYCVTDFIKAQLARYPKVVVLGDFNIAPTDQDVYDPLLWQGKVLVSDIERNALKTLLDLGLTDVFRCFEQADKSFSWWDYRGGQFWKNAGLRIDLILVSAALKQQCQSCFVDTHPRKRKRPSDHAPVVATFA